MQPKQSVNQAFDMAKAAVAKGGKPSAVKVKVKFENKKMGAVRKKAKQFGLSDKNGVTK